ncbi:unnamed protein product [Lupinus luteus]|uniref:Uncharacterized protein n=1 Tax=Lupinus luteus TaxID=3873 RepID=A0AAV1X0G2_LUPLU
MNFLMRSTASVYSERSSIPEPRVETHRRSMTASCLETVMMSEDPFDSSTTGFDSANELPAVLNKHLDVSDEEGCITIPYKELPENWNEMPDMQSLCSLDRSFLFPGEQVHILACLSACKQDTETITPFKVAAVMRKDGTGHSPEDETGNIENRNNSVSGEGELSTNGEEQTEDVYHSESLLKTEAHERQTALLLQKFENSHFFVRISESSEPLWFKKGSPETFSSTIKVKENSLSSTCAFIDRGNFDATISGGAARNSAKYCALPNGDIVVLLQVNVGVNFLRDPCIEILQFEKCRERIPSPDNRGNAVYTDQDPCAELLNWVLPLDNTVSTRPLPSPRSTSNSGISSSSQRSNISASSGSLFSNFRSYSMSSLPQGTTPPAAPVKAASSKPAFDVEDWDQIPSQKFARRKTGLNGFLSFRGISLEQDRFSVCCGLEGDYTPGRRWRRKLEIIQPVEIHSWAANCNSEDLLCVQIKNVAPAHTPDIVMFIDAITIVLEESTTGGPPPPSPISCIEAGNDHFLPNLSLRRGEEHSFILKPATSMWKNVKVQDNKSSQLSKFQSENKTSKLSPDGKKTPSINDKYVIMVSCRCNYTASRLFFKQPTNWQPVTSRDVMISVATEMSGQIPGPFERTRELPVQILTLQASNLTSEDLTLTVLAPASFTSPPSVVSLNSPTTPRSPFIGFTEFVGRVNGERGIGATQGQSFTSIGKENEEKKFDGEPQEASMSDDVIPSSGLSCTHLWLQSKVPLGCIPSRSTATTKLELLPLTDGIITLDSLQIDVKEKGLTYIPECSLKINATSSISKGII